MNRAFASRAFDVPPQPTKQHVGLPQGAARVGVRAGFGTFLGRSGYTEDSGRERSTASFTLAILPPALFACRETHRLRWLRRVKLEEQTCDRLLRYTQSPPFLFDGDMPWRRGALAFLQQKLGLSLPAMVPL